MPQMYKNWKNGRADSLSRAFLANWLMGDVCNFVGCLLTGQLPFQVREAPNHFGHFARKLMSAIDAFGHVLCICRRDASASVHLLYHLSPNKTATQVSYILLRAEFDYREHSRGNRKDAAAYRNIKEWQPADIPSRRDALQYVYIRIQSHFVARYNSVHGSVALFNSFTRFVRPRSTNAKQLSDAWFDGCLLLHHPLSVLSSPPNISQLCTPVDGRLVYIDVYLCRDGKPNLCAEHSV